MPSDASGEPSSEDQGTDPTTPLADQVKDALEHLYDLGYLERHDLAQGYDPREQASAELAGQRLRRELSAAIESMNPGPGIAFRAPQARAYNLMIMHYVEGVTVQEAAHKLGISRRQAHRDLREAIERVAGAWAARQSARTNSESSAAQLSSVQAEVARLEPHPRPTDINALLSRVQDTVSHLAAQRQVVLRIQCSENPIVLSTDPVLAEQVLVSVLSHVLGRTYPSELNLALRAQEEEVTLVITYYADPEAPPGAPVDLVITQVADRLGWRVTLSELADRPSTIALSIPRRGPSILVIDDNAGLVSLVERYLTAHAYRVVPAANGHEGLKLAQDLLPDAIVLDVMMPEMPGWEVLQRLRNHPHTSHIPVIICSVFNNPELAYSLGASLFIPKPIGRQEILEGLRQLDVV
jgi:CheY-like chemotaxis protein